HYRWDGDQLVQQQSYRADGNAARQVQWVYEPGSFRPLAQWEAGEQDERLHYIVTDVAGTARELCSEAGDIIWRGEQRLWGNYRADTIPQPLRRFLGDAANDETYCELRYQGQIYDQETGLYYNRHRYFDPELGQYISPDPIGFAGGLRPQGYVHNPLEWVDPLGLERFPTWMSTKQVYERHHIIPYEHRNHDFFNRTDLNINGATNMIYLPVADNIHPTKMVHHNFKLDGKPHSEYNAAMRDRLDALELQAQREGWSKEKANQEALKLQHDTRAALNRTSSKKGC
ncbi:RHS repeat-associated core domain-containing protein, partial [Plesiomonas sp. ZOR0011]|uniref:RHS repeat-associated core domain-containing protein n=1 Tax=Plesiomonas sp. ZOR0011 TaxID=1339230 RepID=UPI0015A51F07